MFSKKVKKEYDITEAWVKYIGPSSHPDCQGVMLVGWVANGIGFGELTFYNKKARKNSKNYTFYCETECMSKEFVNAVMKKLLESGITYLDG